MWICEFKPYPAHSNQKNQLCAHRITRLKAISRRNFLSHKRYFEQFLGKRKKPLNRMVKGFSLAPVTGLEPVAS